MPTSLGTKIRKLREERKYTLDKLAELTKTSKSYIWELENRDDPPRPSAEKLAIIAEKLGVTINYFLDQDNSITKESEEDVLFHRNYQKQDEATKAKIRSLADLIWNKDDE